MACGCQGNRGATVQPLAAQQPAVLFESVNASGGIVFRSRDEATAAREGASRGGVRVRKAGTQ